jgi:hypothetical protein
LTANISPQQHILRALIIGALFLGAAAALRWLAPEHLSEEMARRISGVLGGAVAFYFANAAPKALTSLAAMRCDPAREQALRRFVGWSIAVGSLAYSVTWLVAPIDIAAPIAITMLAASLALAMGRCFVVRS